MAPQVWTKRDLVQAVIDSGQLPSPTKMASFREVCKKWIEERFPEDKDEDRERFLHRFTVSLTTGKYKYTGDKVQLLQAKKNQAFLDQEIVLGGEKTGPSPPKARKLENNQQSPPNPQPLPFPALDFMQMAKVFFKDHPDSL